MYKVISFIPGLSWPWNLMTDGLLSDSLKKTVLSFTLRIYLLTASIALQQVCA